MRRLAAILLALAAAAAHAAPDLGEAERLIDRSTNDFRAAQELSRLRPNAALARAAQAFADYMARTDRYGHTADGKEPADRARAQGYDYCRVSENIGYQFSAAGFATEELARGYVEGWKESPGHRRNMVDPDAVHMASAVAQSARSGRYYAVQLFGRPRSAAIEFRVANQARAPVRYRVGTEDFTLQAGQQRVHTLCTPRTVTFPQAANAEGRSFRPSGGERLRVEGDRRLVVRSSR